MSRLQEAPSLRKAWAVVTPSRILLAFIIWVAHFLYSSQFGLYEDDWYRVPKTMGISWDALWDLIRTSSMPGPSQGRPLHPAFIYFFSFIGFRWGGLHYVYVIAFFLLFLNALLFYSFLVRVFHQEQIALLGALAFCVFPADTTQPLLTHGLGVQPAISLLLIAFLLYIAGWQWISYLAMILLIFNYETPFLVFGIAPLLRPRAKYELRRHCITMSFILLVAVSFRAITADNRVSHIGIREMGLGIMNIMVGPLICIAMYVYRPIEAIFKMTRVDAPIVILCILVIACALVLQMVLRKQARQALESTDDTSDHFWSTANGKGIVIGIVMLLLAYPLTMTTTGLAVAGRGTRVHTSAILGASIVCAWLCSFLLSKPKTRIGKYTATTGVACFYALLVGFGLTVQHDYVKAWQQQRTFLTELVRLCPSLEDGDVILVDAAGLQDTRQLLFLRKELTGIPETRQIKSLEALNYVLPELFAFPKEWKEPPLIDRLPLDWRSKIFLSSNRLRVLPMESGYDDLRKPVLASHVIFIDTGNVHLVRRYSILDAQSGELLPLKRDLALSTKLTRTAFFKYVVYPDVSPHFANQAR